MAVQLSCLIAGVLSVILLLSGGCATILCHSGRAVYYSTAVRWLCNYPVRSRAWCLLFHSWRAASQLSYTIAGVMSIISLMSGGCATILCQSGRAIYYFTDVRQLCNYYPVRPRAWCLLFHSWRAAVQLSYTIAGVMSIISLISGGCATILCHSGRAVYYFTAVAWLCNYPS